MNNLDYKYFEKSKYDCPFCGKKLLPSTSINYLIGKPNTEALYCYFCGIKSKYCKNLSAAYKEICEIGQISLFEGDFM